MTIVKLTRREQPCCKEFKQRVKEEKAEREEYWQKRMKSERKAWDFFVKEAIEDMDKIVPLVRRGETHVQFLKRYLKYYQERLITELGLKQ